MNDSNLKSQSQLEQNVEKNWLSKISSIFVTIVGFSVVVAVVITIVVVVVVVIVVVVVVVVIVVVVVSVATVVVFSLQRRTLLKVAL